MKKKISLLLMFSMLMTALIGCGSDNSAAPDTASGTTSDTASESTAKDAGEPVEIVLYQFKLEIAKQLDAAAEKYMEQNPNVIIHVESNGDGYATTLQAKMQSGQEPTIFNVQGPSDVSDWMFKLEDMSDQPWISEAADGTLEDISVDGKVYGLPCAVEGYGFVYNKEIFADAGIDAEQIKDFASLEKAVTELDAKIQSGELKEKYPDLEAVFEYPAKETWLTGQHTTNIALSPELGSSLNAYNAKEIEFKYQDQLKAIVDLQSSYTAAADNKEKLNAVDNTTSVENGIAIERVAMAQQGNWIYPSVASIDKAVADKLGILPMPVKGVKEDSIPVGVPMYWVVNKDADEDQKAAAKDFMNWLYQSEEGKEIIVNEFNFIPPFVNYGDLKAQDSLSIAVQEYSSNGKTIPWVFNGYPNGWSMDVMGTQIQKYLSGNASWEEIINEVKKQWTELRK